MDSSTQILSSLGMIGIILAIVLVVCWIILPFAVIGTKPLLRELVREQKRTNEQLAKLQATKDKP